METNLSLAEARKINHNLFGIVARRRSVGRTSRRFSKWNLNMKPLKNTIQHSRRVARVIFSAAGFFFTIIGGASALGYRFSADVNNSIIFISAFFIFLGICLLLFGIFARFLTGTYDAIIAFFTMPDWDICACESEDVKHVYDFARKYFGPQITDIEKIELIRSKFKPGLKILKNRKNGQIGGYIFYFPINKTAVGKIRSYDFSPLSLDKSDVASKPRYGQAVYIGAIAALSVSGRYLMMGCLRSAEEDARKTKTKTAYARAVTPHGLRIVRKHQFMPVHPEADGENCFYHRKF